jgi:very-short-patch-repair endonuclease
VDAANGARWRSARVGSVDVEERLRELGGAARPADLGAPRSLRRAVARLVAEGRVVAHPGGCVALPGADPDVVRARQVGARLTCVSAARAHGFALLADVSVTHVAVPHRRGPGGVARTAGLRAVIHREVPALLTAAPHPAVAGGRGPLVVAPAEALARMLRCQDAMTSIVAIDSALNRRACTVGDLASLLVGPGSPAARAILAECDGRSLSPAESIARVALRRAGLSVEPNQPVDGVGYVDLLVNGRIVVEVDGFAYHSRPKAFASDRRRDRTLQLEGFVVLRFPADEVLRDPGEVVSCVRAALGIR